MSTVFPLPRTGRLLPPTEAAALLTVVDPTAATRTSIAIHREAFGFTARESELAALLMSGHSVESACAALRIAKATGRVHLRRLLGKTDTSRQADLLRLLARIG